MIEHLIEALKVFCEEAVSNYSLPVAVQRDTEEREYRAPAVYKMRLPKAGVSSIRAYAPYIIVQFITSRDIQKPGNRTLSTASVRLIFCTQDTKEDEGAMALVNLMETIRQKLLRFPVIDEKFVLDKEAGLESIAYPEDTTQLGPYFAGEMGATFIMPAIEREELNIRG